MGSSEAAIDTSKDEDDDKDDDEGSHVSSSCDPSPSLLPQTPDQTPGRNLYRSKGRKRRERLLGVSHLEVVNKHVKVTEELTHRMKISLESYSVVIALALESLLSSCKENLK